MGGAGDISALLWEAARVLLYSFLMGLGTEAWSWHCSSRELDGDGWILPRVAMLRQHGMLSFRQAEK